MAALGNVSSMDLLRELGRRYGEEKWMQNRSKKLIFLGAPGCGKGTQAFMLKDHFEVSHISTGDLIREMTKNKTSELGKKLAGVMERGELVDDALITELVVKKIGSDECKKGFILDGFPRTIAQAQSLEEALAAEQKSLDSVFYFDMPHGELSRRITGRRVHPPSGRSYHIEFNPPKVEGKDDETGDDLIQRKDDTEETLQLRMDAFTKQTSPLVEFYSKRGLLRKLDAAAPHSKVSEQIQEIMEREDIVDFAKNVVKGEILAGRSASVSKFMQPPSPSASAASTAASPERA